MAPFQSNGLCTIGTLLTIGKATWEDITDLVNKVDFKDGGNVTHTNTIQPPQHLLSSEQGQ